MTQQPQSAPQLHQHQQYQHFTPRASMDIGTNMCKLSDQVRTTVQGISVNSRKIKSDIAPLMVELGRGQKQLELELKQTTEPTIEELGKLLNGIEESATALAIAKLRNHMLVSELEKFR